MTPEEARAQFDVVAQGLCSRWPTKAELTDALMRAWLQGRQGAMRECWSIAVGVKGRGSADKIAKRISTLIAAQEQD